MCYSDHNTYATYDSLNKNPSVTKYMSNIFHLRSPKSRLSFLRVVNVLFRHVETQGSNNVKEVQKLLTKKRILLLLLGSDRIGTIKSFTIKRVILKIIPVIFIEGTKP